jgi:hypothetical protein
MKHGDVGVALEVCGVECKYFSDTVCPGNGDQTGVEDLDALDLVAMDESFPLWIDGWRVGQKSEYPLDAGDFLKGFVMR